MFKTGTDEVKVFHGYELALIELVAEKLGTKLEFSIKDGDFFLSINTDYNLVQYCTRKNIDSRKFQDDAVCAVVITEALVDKTKGEYSVSTFFNTGNWIRWDLTRAELFYAAVFDLELKMAEEGYYVFPELIEMNNQYFDQLENL